MIKLTKLNGSVLVINSDLIEFIEVLPDSLITLTTGKKIMVKEGIAEIIAAVVEFRRRLRAESDSAYRRSSNPDADQKSPEGEPAE